MSSIPIIDISPLINKTDEKLDCARKIGDACQEHGFFYAINHGVSEQIQNRLEFVAKKFFYQPAEIKNQIRIKTNEKGYFAIGEEKTSGVPDLKSGIYYGNDYDDDHPGAKAKISLFGKNLFPESMPEMKEIITEYMTAITELSHQLMKAIALSLNLDEDYFYDRFTRDPIRLLGLMYYPVVDFNTFKGDIEWGVGEHTDYGFLVVLKQDDCGGLQVKSKSKWIDAPYVPNSFVCNIGDMLDRLTGGLYKSTPHRVKRSLNKDRFSYPFFFDPNYFAEIKNIEGITVECKDDKDERWDKESIHEVSGIFGDYVCKKLSRILPEIKN